MCCSSWVVLIQDLGQNTRCAEKSQSARDLCGLARKRRLEALFGNILVVGVGRVLGMDVFFFQ